MKSLSLSINPIAESLTISWSSKKSLISKLPISTISESIAGSDAIISLNQKEIKRFAKKYSITIILKGPTDLIPDGENTYLNPTNTPGMTVGGTADILSGIIAGMLARNRNALESAVISAYFNGLAGKSTQKKLGPHMTATDLLDALPSVMKSFDKIKWVQKKSRYLNFFRSTTQIRTATPVLSELEHDGLGKTLVQHERIVQLGRTKIHVWNWQSENCEVPF